MAKSREEIQEVVAQHPRKFGAAFTAFGLAFLYWKLVLPLQQSAAKAENISISVKATVLGVTFFVLGITYCVFGVRAVALLNPRPGQSKVLAVTCGILLTAFAFAVFFALKYVLASRGYVFH
jgi:hypothetical protein